MKVFRGAPLHRLQFKHRLFPCTSAPSTVKAPLHSHGIMPMSNPVTCPICSLRKDKRFCPAIHGRICPQCCGEQREVTLDCPSDCPYLLQAREHEKPQPAVELNPSDLFLEVELSDQFMYEREHLILGLSFALAKSAHTNRALNDRDLIATLTSLAKSYETLVNSGLV
jgi:hypothetical protein